MIRSDAFKDILRKENILLWGLLAFQAGFLNAGGFVACHRFVSHVTGYGTQVGLAFTNDGILMALEMALAPMSFIGGAAFAAYLIDRPYYQHKEGKVGLALVIQATCLLLVFVFGELGIFGEFGEPLVLQRDFALLFTLCFICGLQNGTFASLTNGQIRTTHMTGLSTDLGLNMTRIRYLNVEEKEKRYQRRVNWLRLFTFLCFMTGSGLAAYVFSFLGYHGFLVPTLTSLIVLARALETMRAYESESKNSSMPLTT